MTIEYETPEFHASVAEVRRTAESLSNARARASGEVESLLDVWHGAAAALFAEGWTDWLDSSARVAASLDRIADALEAFLRDLTTTDTTVSASVGRLAGQLP